MKIVKPSISKIIEFLICISFFSLTFRHEISSVCLYLAGFFSIIELIKRKTNYFKKNNFVLIFFISYFLIEIIGMFYSKNLYFAIKDIESKLLFLIGSLIIIANQFSQNQILKFLKFYVLGICLNLVYLIIVGIKIYYKSNVMPQYDSFSTLMHPTYYSVNLLIGIIAILEYFKLFYNKIITVLLFIFFSVGIVLTDSKAGLICYLLIIILFTIKYILTIRLRMKIIFFVISILISFMLTKHLSKSRITELFDTLQTSTVFNNYNGIYNSTETRIIIWRSTNDVIKKNLILGTGTGDIKDEMNNQYKKTNFARGIEMKYNCHNQFLQIIATFGIILGMLLILILFKLFYDIIVTRKIIFNLIMLVFIINFLFESFLETKAGVETFVLFTVSLSSAIYYNRNRSIS